MISRIKGKLVKKEDCRVYLESGDFTYEILTPKTVGLRLGEYINDGRLELVIYHYLHTDQNKAYPVLIGFLSELEKEFFEKIIKVSGVGPRAALNALDRSIAEIAEAIDNGDLTFLKQLPSIGMQRAKNIIALLQGKMGKFTLIKDRIKEEAPHKDVHKEIAQEAEQVLLQLQYKKKEAADMIERTLKANPQIENLEELLNNIYKQRA